MGCPRYEDCKGGATVRRLARIGANSTILPGVEIGESSLIGAGSVVVQGRARRARSSPAAPPG